jgi:hypothetical protein
VAKKTLILEGNRTPIIQSLAYDYSNWDILIHQKNNHQIEVVCCLLVNNTPCWL